MSRKHPTQEEMIQQLLNTWSEFYKRSNSQSFECLQAKMIQCKTNFPEVFNTIKNLTLKEALIKFQPDMQYKFRLQADSHALRCNAKQKDHKQNNA